MWAALLLTACIATTIAGCWGFGCCRVAWNMTKCGAQTSVVCVLSALGVLVLMFMTLTIYHFLYRVFA